MCSYDCDLDLAQEVLLLHSAQLKIYCDTDQTTSLSNSVQLLPTELGAQDKSF